VAPRFKERLLCPRLFGPPESGRSHDPYVPVAIPQQIFEKLVSLGEIQVADQFRGRAADGLLPNLKLSDDRGNRVFRTDLGEGPEARVANSPIGVIESCSPHCLRGARIIKMSESSRGAEPNIEMRVCRQQSHKAADILRTPQPPTLEHTGPDRRLAFSRHRRSPR
jgi:hypothetical protein